MPPSRPEEKRERPKERRREGERDRDRDKEKAKTHKLSLKGSARTVAEFVGLSPPLFLAGLSFCLTGKFGWAEEGWV